MSLEQEIKKAVLDKKLAEIQTELAQAKKIEEETRKLGAETADVNAKSKAVWWWKTNFFQFFITMATLFGVIGYVYLPYYEKQSALVKQEQDVQKIQFELTRSNQQYAMQRLSDSLSLKQVENYKILIQAQKLDSENITTLAVLKNKERVLIAMAEQIRHKDVQILKGNEEISNLKKQYQHASNVLPISGNAQATIPPSPLSGVLITNWEGQIIKEGYYVDYDELRIGVINIMRRGEVIININKPHSMSLDHFDTLYSNQQKIISRPSYKFSITYLGWNADSSVSKTSPFAIFDIAKYSK